jgi:hypothetical protein
MTPAQVMAIMGEPDVAIGQDPPSEWRYVHVEVLTAYFRDGVLDNVRDQWKGDSHPVNDDRRALNERLSDRQ